jgi:hypothetical protein
MIFFWPNGLRQEHNPSAVFHRVADLFSDLKNEIARSGGTAQLERVTKVLEHEVVNLLQRSHPELEKRFGIPGAEKEIKAESTAMKARGKESPVTCDRCGVSAAKLQRCGRCKVSWYCSVDSPRIAWKHHKADCFEAVSVGSSADRVEVVGQ